MDMGLCHIHFAGNNIVNACFKTETSIYISHFENKLIV